MQWTVHGERKLYGSPWINLHLADVELPDGERFEHHAVRMPFPAAGTLIHDPGRGILLLYRHRFIPNTWGWEIPAGRAEQGETLAEAARREALEETGWEPGPLEHMTTYHYASGISDGTFALYLARGAHYRGEPTDASESDRIAWLPVAEVRRLIAEAAIPDGLTLTALLWAFAFDLL